MESEYDSHVDESLRIAHGFSQRSVGKMALRTIGLELDAALVDDLLVTGSTIASSNRVLQIGENSKWLHNPLPSWGRQCGEEYCGYGIGDGRQMHHL